MTTQFDCALDGILLSSLDESICVLDIREDAPKLRTTSLIQYPEGHRLLQQQRESLSVQIRFSIHEEDPIRRREVAQAVHAWAAKGGLLTSSDRPGQQMAVLCTGYPATAAEDWTEVLTLVFTSARVPYWEDAELTAVVGSGTMTLTAPGTAKSTPVDVQIVNNAGMPLTKLMIRCGDTQMAFDGIEFTAGSSFLLTQSTGTLIARIGGKSVLPCRTPDSDDALLVPCGTSCTVSASADGALQTGFAVRGRYV